MEKDDKIQSSLHSTSLSNIAEFYRDRSVFITGGTGFLGKVLVEKLLRSCPHIKTIYLLMRPKRGQDIRDRLTQEFHKHIIFEKLSFEQPDVMSKIIPVEGNISLPNLGLSGADLELLYDKVSVVFNSAATVRFNEELRTAVQLNVKGPQQLLHICRQMKQLDALVHVSTAFNNLDKDRIEEVVYPSSISPKKLLQIVDLLDDKSLKEILNHLVGKCPNTYTFTKAVAEKLLEEEHGDVPMAIVRPSVVTGALKEPMPGWIDNINGPTGVIAGGAMGILRVVNCDVKLVIDLMPVDIAINLIIAVAWYTATTQQRSSEVKVYTCSTGQHNPITWITLKDLTNTFLMKNPISKMVWYPNLSHFKGKAVYRLTSFLYQHVPAYFLDFVALLCGKKPRLVRLYTKIEDFMSITSFFAVQQWHFVNNNFIPLLDKLSEEDRLIFNFDVRQIDWKKYVTDYCLGIRRYILKETDDTIQAARNRLMKFYLLQKITHGLVLFLLAFTVFKLFF